MAFKYYICSSIIFVQAGIEYLKDWKAICIRNHLVFTQRPYYRNSIVCGFLFILQPGLTAENYLEAHLMSVWAYSPHYFTNVEFLPAE